MDCSRKDCDKKGSFQCPKCIELQLPKETGSFCSQECFKQVWSTHKDLHKVAKKKLTYLTPKMVKNFQFYQYTGPLRPGKISLQQRVPENIPKPDYAVTGVPASEDKVRAVAKAYPQEEETIMKMRRAGRLAGRIVELCHSMCKPGVTTDEIDQAVHKAIVEAGAYPSPLNYRNFPKSLCTSVNEVICHGIPDSRPLQDGDICNFDITVYLDGVHGDTNATFLVGEVDKERRRLVDCARECLQEAIKIVKPGTMYRDVGKVISKVAQRAGFSVVKTYCGHGIHKLFHCAPSIPHYAKNKAVGTMQVGHTFTIEPMINEGGFADEMWPDNWTAVTRDGKCSAQFEHTLVVTETGCEILTVNEKDFLFTEGNPAEIGSSPAPNVMYVCIERIPASSTVIRDV